MKIYIKSNRNQHILDNLVDGNKLWNPLTGEYDTLSEEQLENLRNPKPVLLDQLKLTDTYVYRDNLLQVWTAAGLRKAGYRVYRLAGNYKIYINSFPNAALPYSTMYVADTEMGRVYVTELTHNTGGNKRDIDELVEWLREGNTLEGV